MAKTIIDVDLSEKFSMILINLINSYPALEEGVVRFSMLNESSGIGFFPSAGSALIDNYRGITGDHYQMCAYQFDIIYRFSPKTEEHKERAKEFLDGLGRWLERQPVLVGDFMVQLEKYPDVESGHRVIKEISRNTASHLQSAYADGVEDWAISLTMRYTNYY